MAYTGDGAAVSLLELFCGNGNHTVALSGLFDSVVAVEINQTLCDAAETNLALNGVTNASIVCMPRCVSPTAFQPGRNPRIGGRESIENTS